MQQSQNARKTVKSEQTPIIILNSNKNEPL
jgi:hypothetical protein